MKVHRWCLICLAAGYVAACATAVKAAVIPTSFGAGADAEVREDSSSSNRGSSNEIATRIIDNFPPGHANDGQDRTSAIYLKFDIAGQPLLGGQKTAVQMTYRNTNLTTNRVQDTFTPNPAFRTGIAFYGLHPDHPGNSWTEAGITYETAPGINFDFSPGTKDFDTVDPDGGGPLVAPLVPLGVQLFPVIAPQNRLPVGGVFEFISPQLDAFIASALTKGKSTVTVVASVAHDGKVPVNDWKNFNYLFNPKEMTTLNADPTYDADTTNPNNPLGSPWSAASNATDANGFSAFSPRLIITPEPGALGLLAVGAAALALVRRRS